MVVVALGDGKSMHIVVYCTHVVVTCTHVVVL